MNEKILMLIDKLINGLMEEEVNAWYEVMIERDFDYIENLFPTKEEFDEFIEKWTPKKCCVRGEDND